MSSLRWNMLVVALVAVLGFFQYRLWFESGGIVDLLRLRSALAQQAAQTEKMKKENDAMLAQVKRLQSSQQAVESLARNELGMMKKDETFYQIVK